MKYLIMILALSMFLLTGCETTGNKRQNGTNTDHVNAKLKHVTVYGALTIGGGTQSTRDASQEGLGKVKANASVDDALNGNVIDPNAIRDIVKPVPPVNVIPVPDKPLSLGGDVPVNSGE